MAETLTWVPAANGGIECRSEIDYGRDFWMIHRYRDGSGVYVAIGSSKSGGALSALVKVKDASDETAIRVREILRRARDLIAAPIATLADSSATVSVSEMLDRR